jgi:hypothetical protein
MVRQQPPPLPAVAPKKRPRIRSQIQTEIMPRWLRINGAVQYSGFSRAKLYELIAQGKIKTALIKAQPDSAKGIRLLDRCDLDAFVNQQINHVAHQLRQEQLQLLEQQKQLEVEGRRLAQEHSRLERELQYLEPKITA